MKRRLWLSTVSGDCGWKHAWKRTHGSLQTDSQAMRPRGGAGTVYQQRGQLDAPSMTGINVICTSPIRYPMSGDPLGCAVIAVEDNVEVGARVLSTTP